MVSKKELVRIRVGIIGRQILFLLMRGPLSGWVYSYSQNKWFFKDVPQALANIKKKQLNRAIRKLYQSKLIDIKHHPNGEVSLILTEDGKKRVLKYNIDNIKLTKKGKWDGYWRFVIFDIPENLKQARDTFANKLRELGLYPLQKSVYVYPYEFKDELEFIIEYFGLRRYVRFGLIKEIDNDLHLRKIFNLI